MYIAISVISGLKPSKSHFFTERAKVLILGPLYFGAVYGPAVRRARTPRRAPPRGATAFALADRFFSGGMFQR